MSHMPFSGVITAIVTPFKKNNEIDFVSYHKLLERQKKSGIHGVVVLGTTGENPTLTENESKELILASLEHRSEHFHIYVGSGTNDTEQTKFKSKTYAGLNANGNKPDGIMVVTPYYNKPNSRHLIAHFKDVFRTIPNTPVCVYNVPGRTGINLNAKTLGAIALDNPNLVAIKEAAGQVNAITEMRNELNSIEKKQVNILSGDDPTFAPSLICGSNGVISVTTNLIPDHMCSIYNSFINGKITELIQLQLKLYELNSGIFIVPNPVGIKWMMSQFGLCENILRPPLFAADEQEQMQLKSILVHLEKEFKICP